MEIMDIYLGIYYEEEMPEYIRFKGEKYKWNESHKDYMTKEGILLLLNTPTSDLIEKVEIIDKKDEIEPLELRYEKNEKNNYKWEIYGEERYYNISKPCKIMADKINEIIEEINKLKEQ